MGRKTDNKILEKAWDTLVSKNIIEDGILRSCISNSWKRCLANNVNPLEINKANIKVYDMYDILEQNENKKLLEIARPYMVKLYESVKDMGFIVMLGGISEVTLEMFGDKKMFNIAESCGIFAGASFSEEAIGTTAGNICLIEKKPVRVISYEHYIQDLHNWCCSSAPIFDSSGNLIAVINLSNTNEKNHNPLILDLVVSTAKMIEMELKYINLHRLYKKSYYFLRSAVDNIAEPLVIFDGRGTVSHINKPAGEILGAPMRKCIGQNIYKMMDSRYRIKNRRHIDGNVEEVILEDAGKAKSVFARFMKVKGPDLDDPGYMCTFKELHKNQDEHNRAKYTFDDIIYCSGAMEKVVKAAKNAAFNDIALFISGESGTGKELLAQSIHNYGYRRNGPFVVINCAALSKDLVQSELFGYEEGAFTGAKKTGNPGKFELAQGGTIFLDEIGDMPLDLQSNLLRVLQEKTVVRIGGSKPIPLDVRIISATNKDLSEEVRAGRFRSDLYYRLMAMTIAIPPLRDRKEDIEKLFYHFIKKHSMNLIGSENIKVSPEVVKVLMMHDWPGNVRELENAVLFALSNVSGNRITIKELPDKFRQYAQTGKELDSDMPEIPIGTLSDAEKFTIANALKYCNNNISKTAAVLGITRATLYKKIKKYNIKY
ncbi:MAG: sigma-54 dependent transcriptional regulator, acetoin dehydrogenase operon transcriptional [Tepidanaerobacteraceae bacterium]|nr:sigma-54 dependent transcriptional regulator, acetoin dehydrogenase operon transcriptional [Tepidanaerobacteraceae bacterium]